MAWAILGIAPGAGPAAIEDAYRRKLTSLDLSSDANLYSRLAQARSDALAHHARDSRASATSETPENSRTAGRLIVGSKELPLTGAAIPSPRSRAGWQLYAGLAAVLLLVSGLAVERLVAFADALSDMARGGTFDPLPAGDRRDKADAMAPLLFGEGVTWADVEDADPYMADALVPPRDPEISTHQAAERARANLRRAMLFSRRDMGRSDLAQVGRVYLGWLKTARAAPGDACREVTGRAFFDETPVMDETALQAEQALAWRLMQDGILHFDEQEPRSLNYPQPLLEGAVAATGMSEEDLLRASHSLTDPAHCDAVIALLEAALERSQTVPLDVLQEL
ncbi:hypothetical protein [Altererythrobacter sp. MTPC7]|uniref:hypothetical protein n=1 Tax=Altererythrobacter sp. MTPC7 TaxID=3056567 RepID=UPI0036F1D910